MHDTTKFHQATGGAILYCQAYFHSNSRTRPDTVSGPHRRVDTIMRHATCSLLLLLLIHSSAVFADSRNVEEKAIRQVAERWDAAWNRHDMHAMASLLTDDADFVNVAGLHWKGRTQIEQEHAERHRTNLKNSISVTRNVEVPLLSARFALVHVDWGMSGDTDFDGTPRSPREGVFTWLMEKKNGAWLIRAAQNTNRAPPK